MELTPTVEFDKNVSPTEAMEAIKNRGACAIHSFVTVERLQEAAALLRSQSMSLDMNMAAPVQRRQHMNMYAIGSEDTPPALASLSSEVSEFVARGGFDWAPNEIVGHRYESTDFIGRHRDYAEAYGLVAVLTLDGLQDFYVELDADTSPTKITMQPGTLTMLRGFTGDPAARPYHWVNRPASQRTAISIRDMRNAWTPHANDWS